jgi:hypothetical protein
MCVPAALSAISLLACLHAPSEMKETANEGGPEGEIALTNGFFYGSQRQDERCLRSALCSLACLHMAGEAP